MDQLADLISRQLAGAFASREEALACALRLLDSGGSSAAFSRRNGCFSAVCGVYYPIQTNEGL